MRGWNKNLGRKLFSIGAATLLWFVFVGRSEIATSIPVMVQYRNIPPDLEITADPPDRLFMKLRGPVSRLSAAELMSNGPSPADPYRVPGNDEGWRELLAFEFVGGVLDLV